MLQVELCHFLAKEINVLATNSSKVLPGLQREHSTYTNAFLRPLNASPCVRGDEHEGRKVMKRQVRDNHIFSFPGHNQFPTAPMKYVTSSPV